LSLNNPDKSLFCAAKNRFMKKLILFSTIAIGIFSGCSEDDDTNNNNNNNNSSCSGATMSVNFAGSNSTHTAFNNTLLKQQSNGQDARRLDLRTNIANGTLVLSVSNWDFQNPPENGVLVKSYTTLDFGPGMSCTNISGFDFCDGALVTYVELSSGTSYFSVGESSGGFVDIDVCDANNKIVSGTFSDILVDFINEDTIEVSGTFSNLCYTVL